MRRRPVLRRPVLKRPVVSATPPPVRRAALRASALGAAALLVSVVTGCSATGSTERLPSSDDDVTPAASASPSEQPSPLDRYIDILYGSTSDEELEKSLRATEEGLAICMAEAGFEYLPRPQAYFDAERGAVPVSDGTRAWVAENGYGIFVDMMARLDDVQKADPNAPIVAALSESESRAYYLALWGDQNSVEGGTTGCSGEVETGEPPLSVSDRYAPLIDVLDRLYSDTIPRDPASLAIEQEWSDCMAGAGQSGLAQRSAAQEKAAQSGDGDNPAAFDGGGPAQRALEIEIALADFDCAESVDYDSRMRTVTVAAETAFVAQNSAMLEPLLAESAQGTAG